MPILTLPTVTPAMKTGTLRRWLKKPGDAMKKGEPLVEIETDDGLAEVESPLAGILMEILTPAGQTVPAGAPLAKLDGEGTVKPSEPKAQDQVRADQGRRLNNPQLSTPNPKPPTPSSAVIPVQMPKAGQSMEEGTLVEWKVQVGDAIKKGDIIFAIETDKATMDVEATDAGRLARIVLAPGGTCKVLEPVAYLAQSDADVDAYLAQQGTTPATSMVGTSESGATSPATNDSAVSSAARGPAGTPVNARPGERVKASPAARKIAGERGVDLSTVAAGSGPGGRILSTDVPAAAGGRPTGTPETRVPAGAPLNVATAASPTAAPGAGQRRKMSKMRQVIARNLLASKQTIPHFYIRLTINADPLYSFYQGEKAKYPCSLNDVVVLGCAKTIMEFPAFRSRIEGDEIVEFPAAHIGIAVGMDEGLVVPVLVNADQLTLKQIGGESKRIANAARSGKIEGLGQGVFTITNLGMFGTAEFDAIINPPEAAILAVGAVREEVIVSGGTMRPGRVMTLTLSCDHRLIDGVLAAKFLARLKEILEWPGQLI